MAVNSRTKSFQLEWETRKEFLCSLQWKILCCNNAKNVFGKYLQERILQESEKFDAKFVALLVEYAMTLSPSTEIKINKNSVNIEDAVTHRLSEEFRQKPFFDMKILTYYYNISLKINTPSSKIEFLIKELKSRHKTPEIWSFS